MSNLYIPLCSLLVAIMLSIIYYSKKKLKNQETEIYSFLLGIGLIENAIMVLNMLIAYLIPNETAIIVLNKIDYILFLSWIWLFFLYIYYISLKKDKKIKNIHFVRNLTFFINIIPALLMVFLPVSIQNSNNIMYSYGYATNVLILMGLIYLIAIIFILLKNWKVIKTKKYFPVHILVLMMVLLIIIREINPALVIISGVITFINLIMYHTIENPDVKMLEEVKISQLRAEKANAAKSEFLSSMSHEIRTPLNAIVGLSEYVSKNEKFPEELQDDMKDIVNASQTLLEIVGNILDISKIESNKFEISNTTYNFEEVAKSVVNINKTRIGDKNIEFNVQFAPDIPYELIGDKIHIKSIINNLISNAIKYTEEGQINVVFKCINKENVSVLIITVQDTGRGIKKEDVTKLFNKFERLGVQNTTTEGTGLGLAIVKRLVDAMNGRINVQSQYGRGSVFMVQIPQKISKITKPLTETQIINTAAIKELSQQNKVLKVLIVDDNKLNIKVARKSLEIFNTEIEECYDGVECLEKIKVGNNYDVILLDIMMPNMDGEETIKHLQEIENFSTPIIALTADAVSDAKEKYLNMGFTDYIAKPFSVDKMKEKISKLL